jgi:hypothetical protein
VQFLVSVIHDGSGIATSDEQDAITTFNEQLRADGHGVFAGGLGSPSEATTVDNRGTAPILTDGPFVETKEFVVGFWVMEATDLEEAQGLAVAASRACHRKVEVRRFL